MFDNEMTLGERVLYIASLVALTIAFTRGKTIWNRRKLRREEKWPDAQGVVTSADWTPETPGERYQSNRTTVAYSYVVNGERYAGYSSREFINGDEAADYVLRVRDKNILVKYKPDHPEHSVLWKVLG
jgi:hypothetical protein